MFEIPKLLRGAHHLFEKDNREVIPQILLGLALDAGAMAREHRQIKRMDLGRTAARTALQPSPELSPSPVSPQLSPGEHIPDDLAA